MFVAGILIIICSIASSVAFLSTQAYTLEQSHQQISRGAHRRMIKNEFRTVPSLTHPEREGAPRFPMAAALASAPRPQPQLRRCAKTQEASLALSLALRAAILSVAAGPSLCVSVLAAIQLATRVSSAASALSCSTVHSARLLRWRAVETASAVPTVLGRHLRLCGACRSAATSLQQDS